MKGSVSKRCKCPIEYDARGRRKSCRKPHGSWTFLVDIGIDPETGKRQQVRKSGYRTSDEAEAELAKFLVTVGNGQVSHDRQLTVEAYLLSFLEAKKAAGMRPTALRSYTQHVHSYLIPHLGRLRLGDLRGHHIEKMLQALAEPPSAPAVGAKISKGKRRNPKPRSAATIRRIHATLRSALTSAQAKHLVPFNAAKNLELPKARRPKVKPWEVDELGTFLDHVSGERLGPLFEVSAMTGLRRGEMCGLRWDDVDLINKVITVRQQLVEVDGTGIECDYCHGEHRQFQFGKPKTESGEDRVVDLDEQTAGVLLAHRFAQDAERMAWGSGYSDHGLIFAREDGTPIPPQSVTERFKKVCRTLGLREIRLHDLRHGQASLLLAADVPLAVVSKRLGHSSIAITADTYSHLLKGVGSKAAEAAAGLVPRKPRDQALQETVRDHSVTTSGDLEASDTASDQELPGQDGAPSRTRTYDLRIKSP
ncbi:Site-specific recombinase XerD [Rhodococcoides kyotonense]|uniref:Site-specific recombinase XerD n=1 Tax=Rhodococcoides kyotonense TaxID=398843 RepID=A0A239E732_9NOCA|nr:Site-specific recombinase XerD [Rhodococcus kyotonensis]